MVSRDSWDNIVVVLRDGNGDAAWDGKVKSLVYDSGTMTWVAEAQPSTSGGSGGGNAAASATGSAVPAAASYTGFNSGGNLVGVSTSNPLPTQAPSAEDSSFTDKPTALAGKYATALGTFTKKSITSTLTAVDEFGNDIIAMAVRDYSRGSPMTASGSLTSGAPTLIYTGNQAQSVVFSVTGTWTGSIGITSDGAGTSVAIPIRTVGTATQQSSVTANGVYTAIVDGLDTLNFIGSALTGQADVYVYSQTYITDVYAHISGTVPLPTNAATSAKQDTGNTSLASIDTKIPASPATSGKQDTGNTSVASIDTKTPALGQAAMAASRPVVIASNQSAVPVTLASGATAIAKAEDSASADADVGVPAMAIQKATPADTAGTDGDYAMLQMSVGRLWASAKIDTALPAGSNVIGHVIVDTAPTTAVTGPLTDTQLRNTAVPVSLAALPALVAGTALVGKVGIDQTTNGTTNRVNIGSDGTVQPGNTPNTTPWLMKIHDGTTAAPVKAASTAVAAADAALVVGVSPNTGISLGISTGKTNVLKTGSLTSSATTADQVVLTYTVTAAKTFYLQYLEIYARLTTLSATATILGTASLETPSGTKDLTVSLVQPTTAEVQKHVYSFDEPIPVATGVVIRVVCTPAAATSTLWGANFGGYEKA